MRILVISDSHKRYDIVKKIILSQPESQDVFFLGDLTRDVECITADFPDKNFHIVCGNCDFNSPYPLYDIVKIGQHNVFLCHGHSLGVKYSTAKLKHIAKQRNCSIVLYGHTHVSNILYEDGIFLVNPGSCSQPRESRASYAVIDIEENGIMPIIIDV